MNILSNALFRWIALTLALLPALPAAAQPALLQQRVTLDAENVPAAAVLARLEKEFGVPFAYFQKPELLQKPVTLRAEKEPLGPVLDRLFAQTALSWQWVGNQVVIREAASAPPAYLTLRGQVLDGETGTPLPYASVSLRGKAAGTVTNPAGHFVFHLPARHAGDTVLVSFLGYAPYGETVAKMAGAEVTVRLAPAPVQLAEVVVKHQPLTAADIVRTAVERIAENYPTGPFIMEGFYRDWTKNRMSEAYAQQFGMPQTATLLEAAVGVYDEGYAPRGNGQRGSRQAYVQEIRKSQDLPGDWFVRKGLSLGLEGDFVKNNRAKGCVDLVQGVLDFRNNLTYELLDTVVQDGESLYRIGAKAASEKRYQDRGMAGTYYHLYISQDDFTMLRIDLNSTTRPESGSETPGRAGRRGGGAAKDSSYWTCTRIDNTLRFRRYAGKAYPSYLRTHYATQLVNGRTDEPIAVGHEFYKELLINDLHTEGVEERHRQLGQQVQQHQRVGEQLKPYNPAFWQHYNIIQDNPLDAELVEVLGQQKPLEKQFTESGTPAQPPAKRKPKRP